ncbi:hypothetical protein HY486_02230 [Candidatus Woesearchaeota archaeon]|nr:hypothetical protein [Candidatus Woesearchaeota archaeon]
MAELKIEYDKTCACMSSGIQIKDENYQALVTISIRGSSLIADSPEFQARFKDSPDTMETQVEMYGALLDGVCDKIDRGIKRIHPEEAKAKEHGDEIKNVVRAAYATMALSNAVILCDDGNPLFVRYLEEKLEGKKPTTEVIENTVNTYLTKLRIKEFSDAKGITAVLISNLEAALV